MKSGVDEKSDQIGEFGSGVIHLARVSAMDDPKQLIDRFVEELWNERRLDVADAIFAKDCVTHQRRSGTPDDAVPRGPEAIKKHVAGWIASFPDLRFRARTKTPGWEFPQAARRCRYGCLPCTALRRARSSRTGCSWNRLASFSNLGWSRQQLTWWVISCVRKAMVDAMDVSVQKNAPEGLPAYPR